MKVVLVRSEINDAILLADKTHSKWANRPGYYPNLYNSHLKGKLGEIASEHAFHERKVQIKSLFRNPVDETKCDIEVTGRIMPCRLEVKTWSLQHWASQGRCVKVEQLKKLQREADAVVWAIVDLPNVTGGKDLNLLQSVTVELAGWSSIEDIGATTPRETGWRKIMNYQVDSERLRPIEQILQG